MSKVDELIKEFCPKGVKFVKFTDLGTFENIGVDKKIVNGEKSVKLLNYMDVYKNHYIDASIPTMTVTASDAKISKCSVEAGDIFITPTSETRDDIGHSAVATETIEGAVYSYHIMRFRLFKPEMVTSFFLNYVFESGIVQKQILKAAQGMTRYGVSAKKFSEFSIPIPPFEVQKEIVNILDKFTQLEVELSAELDARRKQYEYYSDQLLTFDDDVNVKKLHQIAEIYDSLHQTPKYSSEGLPMIRVTDIKGGYVDIDTALKVDLETFEVFTKKYKPQFNDIVVSRVGSYGNFSLIGNKGEVCLGQNTAIMHPLINAKYLYYALHSPSVTRYIENNVGGGSQKTISLATIKGIPIHVPSPEEQVRIVDTLDKFDTLTSSISEGLPAEIKSRRKQYEYYRSKLLTFQELPA